MSDEGKGGKLVAVLTGVAAACWVWVIVSSDAQPFVRVVGVVVAGAAGTMFFVIMYPVNRVLCWLGMHVWAVNGHNTMKRCEHCKERIDTID